MHPNGGPWSTSPTRALATPTHTHRRYVTTFPPTPHENGASDSTTHPSSNIRSCFRRSRRLTNLNRRVFRLTRSRPMVPPHVDQPKTRQRPPPQPTPSRTPSPSNKDHMPMARLPMARPTIRPHPPPPQPQGTRSRRDHPDLKRRVPHRTKQHPGPPPVVQPTTRQRIKRHTNDPTPTDLRITRLVNKHHQM